jgi:hypothetical protein
MLVKQSRKSKRYHEFDFKQPSLVAASFTEINATELLITKMHAKSNGEVYNMALGPTISNPHSHQSSYILRAIIQSLSSFNLQTHYHFHPISNANNNGAASRSRPIHNPLHDNQNKTS